METIYALATPRGKSGVAVIRISGPAAGSALERLSGLAPGPARMAEIRRLYDPVGGSEIDQALVLTFCAPASFTGEDVVELQVHGGLAVVDSLLAGLAMIDELRPAEAGEFTRRAVENGKMDLTEAEGIADLIDAETLAQQSQALRQMEGGFGRVCNGLRDRLLRALAYVEAEIDFSEEEIPDDLLGSIVPVLTGVSGEIETLLGDRQGERVRDGLRVAVLGEPNVGKSSLVNWLAGSDAVIVSDIAGTTRDVVDVRLNIAGVPVTVSDTAGLRDTDDLIEREGVRRARLRAEEADCRIWMVKSGESFAEDLDLRSGDLRVVNKIDQGGRVADGALGVSVKTGAGLDAFQTALEESVRNLVDGMEAPGITRARHRRELEGCLSALRAALALAEKGEDIALVAEEIRRSVRHVGRVTGEVDVEELLDVVFRDFCIGK